MGEHYKVTSLRDVLTHDEMLRKEEEIRQRVANDDRLQEILDSESFAGVTEETIKKSYASLLRYLDDKKICLGCRGYDSCPKLSKKGHRIGLQYDPFMDQIVDKYQKCEYFLDICKQWKYYLVSDYDLDEGRQLANKVYKSLSMSKSTIQDSFIAVATKYMQKYAKFSKKENNEGAFITCENMNAEALLFFLAHLYSKKGFTVALLDASKTLTDCSSFDKDVKAEANQRLELAEKADVLFITKIGFEYKSAAAKDLILTPLLFKRNKEGFATYFSSYMSLDDLCAAYARDKASREMLKSLFDKIVKQDYINDIELFTK